MKKETFILKKEHIKLLNQMSVGWQDSEFGAQEIDPKRPYGNSNVYQDIAKILGIETSCSNCGEYSDEEFEFMNKLHKETETALQIVLQYGLNPGKYECDSYSSDWKLVNK